MKAGILNVISGHWVIQVLPDGEQEKDWIMALGTQNLKARVIGAMLIVEVDNPNA